MTLRCPAVRGILGAIPIAAVATVVGCQSFDGYKVIPVRNAAGVETGEVRLQPVKGIPIVVKRPTKAVFIVIIKTFRRVASFRNAQGRPASRAWTATEVTAEKEPMLIGPSEVYTIDLKRPFFGKIDYTVEFENQYPKKIDGKVDDKTLSEVRAFVNDLISKLAPVKGLPGITKQSGETVTSTLVKTEVKFFVVDLTTGKIQTVSF